ncbi:unnamed protein product [Ambrosiozyma monospora]|uniref:ATPase inhibitor, mitochondrial n=1 Tax=Ambrosiozyma monospora TaxID=43982 RepID=A0A9W6YQ69_AMBMO|nr:unnamed protein product [Ambrosiozyma monospora]
MFSRRVLALPTKRISLRMYSSSEGATGATRPSSSSDAFTKREKAQEDLYVKKHEADQLAKLKADLEKHKKELEELEKQINKA